MSEKDYKYDMRQEHTTPAAPPAPPKGAYPKRPSRFWLFLLSFIPGVGHMYLGLIRRGLFYFSALALMIYLTATLSIGGGSFLTIFSSFAKGAIFFVSFFEAFKLRREMVMGNDVKDEFPAFLARKEILMVVAVIVLLSFFTNLIAALPWFGWLIVILFAIKHLSRRRKDDNGSK